MMLKIYPEINLFFLMMGVLFSCSQSGEYDSEVPEGFHLFDDRLELSLVAAAPDIVTPIGIAVDSMDRIYVLESHTHLPPKDYEGPKDDKIKVFVDSNGDGKLDSMRVFAEGIQEGLNIAFSPEGHLYVVTSKEVWVYYDRDRDGISEENRILLGLTAPQQVYAHAAVLSIAFSTDGWMYIGRGNTGGAGWVCEGSDGSKISGYGDGGNIMRARLDGSQLEEFATGFWNPFDLKFDNYGRLMVADNDPDSRGPNRLVHAVQEGDYGYRSIFGGSGIHPYSAWNGELPGTLPYAVALGEAPSGLLNASQARLPKDYQNQMLCTIWEESTIVRTNMKDAGVSVAGDTEVILSGPEDFRPVAFATDSQGNIYFTDWVLRDYPNHGKGKIWKLSTKIDVEALEMRGRFDPVMASESEKKLQAVFTANADFESFHHHLQSKDPFMVHAAVVALNKGKYKDRLIAARNHEDPDIRMGVLLALQKSGDKEVEYVSEQFLSDPDLQIRKMALIWAGKSQITERRKDLEMTLTSGVISIDLFETYLETVKMLHPEFVESHKNRKELNSKSLKRVLPDNFISSLISNPDKPAKMRIFALTYLEDLSKHKDLLQSFLTKENDPELRLEVVRILKSYPDKDLADQLLQIAQDKNNPPLIRSEAILSLSNQPLDDWEAVIQLLQDDEESIQIESARYLRSKVGDELVRNAFETKLKKLDRNTSPLLQQLELGLGKEPDGRPANTAEEEWQALLAAKGDAEAGRRVFYSNTSMCSSCHAVDNHGGNLGPDLSNVGASKGREQLVSSILLPSDEISPEWQGWYIKHKDSMVHQGRQIDVGSGSIKIFTEPQGFVTFNNEEIEDYGLITTSLMPEGLERNLTDQDLRDLLAFLQKE